MLEDLIKTILDYISITIMHIKGLTLYVLNNISNISPNNVRLTALVLIISTFSLFIIMTFIFYIKSLLNLIKEAGTKPANKEPKVVLPKIPQKRTNVQAETKPLPQNYNVGLILDMINRGVTEFKIAQILMSKVGDIQTHEQILQTIKSTKEFVDLCKSDKLKDISHNNPQNKKLALSGLAKGDISSALSLMMSFMENEIKKIDKIKDKKEKRAAFNQLSEISCLLGAISSLDNLSLAINCFEMAIELDYRNINAWSRVADMYNSLSLTDKAIWTYNKILEIANTDKDKQQIANANLMLAKHYGEQNSKEESEDLYSLSKDYYENLKIDTKLNKEEREILEFIESTQDINMDNTISSLLDIV